MTRALLDEGASVAAGPRELSGGLSTLVDAGYPGGLDLPVNTVGAVKPRPGGFLSVDDNDWIWALGPDFVIDGGLVQTL